MEQVKNIKSAAHKKFKATSEEKKLIMDSLNKIIDEIKDIEKFHNNIFTMTNNEVVPFFIYTSVCLLLGESKDLLSCEIDWDEISYQYMVKIREVLQQTFPNVFCSLFGGLAGIGFGVYALYKSTSYYKKFIDSLNEIIIDQTMNLIKNVKSDLSNVNISAYDTISGLSGMAGYLLLFKGDQKVKKCIQEILKYFVLMTNDREVFGEKVLGWHVSSKNQFLEEEKSFYKKGNFNFSLSHGITGPLAVLSIALNEGIEVEGHKDSIKRILRDLKKFNYIDEKGNIYWPGKIKFEDYINGEWQNYKSRASWCYGTPGIARSMYLAGKAINDTESIKIAIKAIEGVCNMEEDEWMLDSPIICHGYAGTLAVVQSMYYEEENPSFDIGRKKLLKKLLSFFNKDSKFGFYNIEIKELGGGQCQLIKKDDVSLLEGSIGVILTLLTFIKPIKTDWMRFLLIK